MTVSTFSLFLKIISVKYFYLLPPATMSSQVSQVLVTGASGLLGRAVCSVLREKGYAVKGVAFSR